MIILNYFAIGALLVFAMELWIDPSKKDIVITNEEEEEFRFDWITRIFNIVLWPLTLAIVLKHMVEWVKNILK